MEGEDRISALPDGILCHILSFLPTRDTIATGRLSKRWRPLWYTIPVIDIHLDDQTYLRNGCIYSPFLNFAYAALLLRNTQQPLMLARLRINTRVGPNYTFPEAHLNIWVKAVLERGLQHLHLEMPRYLSLTSIVFNCRTLVVLKLHRVSVDILQSVDLPALKTLYLNCVRARGTGYVSMILHRCPVLEELKVNRINFGIAEYHNIPTLMRADVGFDFGIEFPLKVVSNVQVLRYFLEYNHQLGFPMFLNLIYLNLNFVSYFKWDMVIQLLAHCPNLQNFVINMPVVTDVIEGWGYRQFAPSCISSKLRKCTIVNCRGLDCEVHFVKYMLHHSRVLQTMTIHHCLRNMWGKFRMLQRLAMCSRGSATCRLIFK